MTGQRAKDPQYAQRVNTAARLLATGMPPSEVAHTVAQQFSVSDRQGSRYVAAAGAGPVAVPQERVVFTVKLPGSLVGRVRAHTRASGSTISGVVAVALAEFFTRHHDSGPAGGADGMGNEPGGQGE
jgi:hypothetical protein